MIVGSLYRPNSKYSHLTASEQFNQFSEILANTLSTIPDTTETLILGDINLNALCYDNCNFTSSYIDLLFASGYLQTTTKPTRCTINSATLIDHSITNITQSTYQTAIITSKLSDHFPLIFFKDTDKPKKKKEYITVRDFSQDNIKKFSENIQRCNW